MSSKADDDGDAPSIIAQFRAAADAPGTGPQLALPLDITPEQLQRVLREVLTAAGGDADELRARPFALYVDERAVDAPLARVLERAERSTEGVLSIVYQPQALFRVRAVARCAASLGGHGEAVLSVAFAPDGSALCSGSGDCTVRVWDLATLTPAHTLRGHRDWVLAIAWAPRGDRLATASNDGDIRVWAPRTGQQLGNPLRGHRKHVNAIAWEPLHRDPAGRRLVSAGKDTTVRVWDTMLGRCLFTLSGHALSVTCVRWGGEGLIYSGGQDRLVKVWDPDSGKLVRELKGHAHWVNTMALSTDYALRTGACDDDGRGAEALKQLAKKDGTAADDAAGGDSSAKKRRTGDASAAAPMSAADAQHLARVRYDALRGAGERMITGSDDHTLLLWKPTTDKRPVARMVGHQQLINDVRFTPDGMIIASGSFDKSIRLWHGVSGKFIATLRGHVSSVFQLAWSADGRMLVSASRDSTVKVWNVAKRKMVSELPGHSDAVYAVDWAPDGSFVASGSKDRLVKIWRA